jgi:hypothetical protein
MEKVYKITIDKNFIKIKCNGISFCTNKDTGRTMKELILEFHAYIKKWEKYHGEEMENQSSGEF